jgi:hypothetical protein
MSTHQLDDGVWSVDGVLSVVFEPYLSSRRLLGVVAGQLHLEQQSRRGLPLLTFTGTFSREANGELYLSAEGYRAPLNGLAQRILVVEHNNQVIYMSRRYTRPT